MVNYAFVRSVPLPVATTYATRPLRKQGVRVDRKRHLPLSDLVSNSRLVLSVGIRSPRMLSFIYFNVGTRNGLSSSHCVIFFGRPAAPYGDIDVTGNNSFALSLTGLPTDVSQLIFAASVSNTNTVHSVRTDDFDVGDLSNRILTRYPFSNTAFTSRGTVVIIRLCHGSNR